MNILTNFSLFFVGMKNHSDVANAEPVSTKDLNLQCICEYILAKDHILAKFARGHFHIQQL